MNRLKWWMRIVGGFYILLAIQNLPFIVSSRISTQYPALDAPVESVAVQALIDMWFLFGVEIGVVGLMLLIASRAPVKNKILVQTVLALELLRGVAIDLYWVAKGDYVEGFYIGFAIVHAVIIVTGWLFLRRAVAEGEALRMGRSVAGA